MKQISNSHLRWPKGRRSCVKYISKERINNESIIHLASNTHPKQYAEDPIGTIMTNIYGCDNLLKLAVEKKARFLLASSVEIYGQGTAIPMNEEYCGYIDCNLARSGYNEAKRTCEALTQSYRSVFGVNAVIARFARVFGADKKHDTKMKMVMNFRKQSSVVNSVLSGKREMSRIIR